MTSADVGVGPDVDVASLVARFAARLRSSGAPVDVRAVRHCAAALGRLGPGAERRQVYWACRVTLVHRAEELDLFDRVFAEVFGPSGPSDAMTPAAPTLAVPSTQRRPARDAAPALETEAELPWATRPRQLTATAGEQPDEAATAVPVVAASRQVAADAVPLDGLDPAEVRRLGAELRSVLQDWPRRRTRRLVDARRGQVALRASAAAWRRTGGEPVALARRAPRRRPRRLVVLCDVSESMQPHVTGLLHLLRAAATEGAGETFAFGTCLTRITPMLAHRDPAEAVALASATVADRFAGTRIAHSLRELLGSHHGELLRGAVCVVASDGWDADPPEETARQVARLARRVHRLVWLNPRAGEPGFEPLAGGMAAALPSCDLLLPAGTTDDLRAAIRLLSSTASRRPPDGSA